ncbi:Jouberin [Entophlyctis luteolus]|nr:Jouberin [Entophlyctis luteolus]
MSLPNDSSHPNLSMPIHNTIHNIFEHVNRTRDDFEGFVTNFHVAKTDALIADAMVLHPVVRVHILDASTGQYVKKSPEIPATTFNEQANLDFILPVMTKPFSFQKHQTTAAAWNEDILVICEYLSLLHESTIVFFEVLDFGTMGTSVETNGGWRRVAWAFVKLIAGHNRTNTEIPLRLQLFEYPAQYRIVTATQALLLRSAASARYGDANDAVRGIPFVFKYVEISGTPCPEPQVVCRRPEHAIEREMGKLSYDELMDEYLAKRTLTNELAVKVSSSIFNSVKGEKVATIDAHTNIVYDLKWANGADVLATASSDCTVRVYQSQNHVFQQSEMCFHPSYVYTVAFHPQFPSTKAIFSGCEDSAIRIWSIALEPSLNSHMQPMSVLHGHLFAVNSIVLDSTGSRMYSADGGGILRIWSLRAGTHLSFDCVKSVSFEYGIRSLAINFSGRKLAIFLSSNEVFSFDTRIYRTMTKYSGMPLEHNYHQKPTKSEDLVSNACRSPKSFSALARVTFSACGSYVFAGGSDGTVFVWKAETGALIYVYRLPGVTNQIVDIAFHPLDNYIAFSIWSSCQAVCVYTWDDSQDDTVDARISVAARDAGIANSRISVADKAPISFIEGSMMELALKRPPKVVDPQVRSLRRAADDMIQKLGIVPDPQDKGRIGLFSGIGKTSAID